MPPSIRAAGAHMTATRPSMLCLYPSRIVDQRGLARRDLHSGRAAAEIQRGPQVWRCLEGVEQRVTFHAEQHRVHFGGDGGVSGCLIEQAALTEAVARTEMHDGPAVSVHHDAAVYDGVESMRRSALDNDVNAWGQRDEPRGRGELLQDDLRHSHCDRQALEDLHPRRKRVGTLRVERIESAQAKTTQERDQQRSSAKGEQTGT